jgi:hypothetical protein
MGLKARTATPFLAALAARKTWLPLLQLAHKATATISLDYCFGVLVLHVSFLTSAAIAYILLLASSLEILSLCRRPRLTGTQSWTWTPLLTFSMGND